MAKNWPDSEGPVSDVLLSSTIKASNDAVLATWSGQPAEQAMKSSCKRELCVTLKISYIPTCWKWSFLLLNITNKILHISRAFCSLYRSTTGMETKQQSLQ